MNNLLYSIKKILNHEKYFEIANKPLEMFLSHANYHGDNLLINNDKIFIIDPDVSIPIVPRSFALARFIYTYIHDSAEYCDYNIYTEWFNKGIAYFDLRSNVSSEITESYEYIFSDLLNFSSKNIKIFNDLKIFSKEELQLSYLFCLLRGIKANQSNINFIKKDGLNYFQEKGTFIYLNCVKYLNWLLKDF